ncbi:aminotransferase class I/II-fold pyridoxal phosphate-dependent enzyme [Allocoprobacillus halotolerans]|uniref:aminotransferase class I/II-fold pyridoxal phosphate-dependent enzyme n=1 Tax=Allocoprobacillus halotolerans TaxID=2944914 RepID=UPI00338F4E41
MVITSGVVGALKLAVKAFTKKDDYVMIMKPVYYPFDASIQVNGRQIVECPLVFKDNHYECDFDVFEKQIIDHDVKMFILCNPHNPIGKVWTKDELYQIGTICQRHHVIVISDEIHMDFIYSGHQHVSFCNVNPSFGDICTAPLKTFNLAALQTPNIIIKMKLYVKNLNIKKMPQE